MRRLAMGAWFGYIAARSTRTLGAKMRVLMWLTLALLVACTDSSRSNPAEWKPGQILDESSTDIGHGYREIRQSIVNPPGSFEGIGHFSFVYFGNVKLCQCSQYEMAFEPDGRFALFVADRTGSLTLFDSLSLESRPISAGYVGHPIIAAWDVAGGRVHVKLRNHTIEDIQLQDSEIQVDLSLGT